jgi:hypothetical protein
MRIIENELNISAPAGNAFNWFKDLDKNYLKWHPRAHKSFVWLSDKPIGEGSRFSFEENIKGHKHKMLMEVSEYVENEKLSFLSRKIEVSSNIFPDRFLSYLSSLFRIRIEMIRTFKSLSANSTKIHTIHRLGSDFPVIGALIEWFINIFIFSSKDHELHLKEEGEYMKINLESS